MSGIDVGGARRHWFDRQPGEAVTRPTSTTHPWLVTTPRGCVTVFYAPGAIEIG